jgi:AcrR family transcriptional regulator
MTHGKSVVNDNAHCGELPLRSDARKNRDQILRAAQQLFASRGLTVPLEDIAKHAGVGVGTLYRRFPGRKSLIQAVTLQSLEALTNAATNAQVQVQDSWGALTIFLQAWLRSRPIVSYDPLSAQLPHDLADREVRQAQQRWLDSLSLLIGRAQSEGSLRQDLTVDDVLGVMGLLVRSPEAVSARILQITIDGMRACSHAALASTVHPASSPAPDSTGAPAPHNPTV